MKQSYLIITIIAFILNSVTFFGQNTISGTIITQSGEKLEGVSVIINNQKGTETKTDGSFKLHNLKNGKYVLKVSLLGYASVLEKIGINNGNVNLTITLTESISDLDQVTINSRSKNAEINDMPTSVNALSSQFIANNNITEFDEIAAFVPGLEILTQNPNTPSIAIRGISSEDSQSSAIPRISTFQDGVYLGKSRGSVVAFFDSESIDVYKGPQTSSFGRTVQSGAIDIIQKKAGNLTEGNIMISTGSFASKYATGAFNTPIIKDKVFLRISGIYDFSEGYIKSFSDEDYNGKETLGLRTALRYQLQENSTLDIIANYQRDTPPAIGFKSAIIGQPDANTDRFGPVGLSNSENLGIDRTVYSVIGLLNHQISSNWKSVVKVGYRNFDSVDLFDVDGSPAPAAEVEEISLGEQASAEIRVNFNSKKIKANIGSHFLYDDTSQEININVNEQNLFVTLLAPQFSTIAGQVVSFPTVPNQIFGNSLSGLDPRLAALVGLPLQSFNTEKGTNFSKNYTTDVFGDITVRLFEKIEIGAGIRASWEQANASLIVTSSLTPTPIGALTGVGLNNITFVETDGKVSVNEDFFAVTGNAFAKFKFTETSNLYINVAKGRRPNIIDFNSSVSVVLSDEELWSYELGSKISALDNKLQINGSIYFYDYNNFRTPVADNGNTGTLSFSQQDSGAATVKGAELSVSYRFGKKSSIFANYSHLETAFDDEDNNGQPLRFAGNRFRQAPVNSYALGGNFQVTIDGKFDYYFRPNFSFKSKVFYTSSNRENLAQPEFGIFNFTTGVILKEGLDISVFMKNVFDKQYVIDAGNLGNSFGIPTYIAGAPTLYGVKLSYSF